MKAPAFLMVIVMLLSASMLLIPEEADADSQYDEHWCYGDMVYFEYGIVGSRADVSWTIYDESMNVIGTYNGNSISFNAGDHDLIYVTQTVSLDGNVANKTEKVNLMHVADELDAGGDGEFSVAFLDDVNGDPVGFAYFGTEAVVSADMGQTPLFVEVPEAPVKEDMTFLGWYYTGSDGLESAFDPSEPVVSDMVVYAKWSGAGNGDSGGSGGTVVIGGTHIVTFECAQGLTYNVVSTGSSSVSFTVSVADGYDLIGDVSVTSTGGTVIHTADGQYILSGISSNIVVSITGNTVLVDDDITDDNPDGPMINNGNDYTLYVILLIILAVICIVLAVYIMRTRGSRV